MRRRDLLRAAAATGTAGLAGLAGCADTRLLDTRSPDRRRIALSDVDPTRAEVSIDVEVLDPVADAASPPRLRVTTRNEGPRREISIAEGMCCLFDRRGGRSTPPGVWLHRAELARRIDRRGDRWTRDRPADEPRRYPAYGCTTVTYDRGETVENEYVLWDDYRVEGYVPPGTYRFVEPVSVRPPDGGEGPAAEFEWGFGVEVTAPGGE